VSRRTRRRGDTFIQLNNGKEVVPVAEKLKKIECEPKCGFMIRSHDEKEIVEIATEHAKKAHKMNITEKEVKGMMKDA